MLPSPPSSTADFPLLATARRLAPQLSARSEEIEAARRLPPDLVHQLAGAGFFRMLLPERYGGLELHPARFAWACRRWGSASRAGPWTSCGRSRRARSS